MPIVQAYLCPRTEKVFLKKDEYVTHLRTMARTSLNMKYHKKKLLAATLPFDTFRKTARSFKDVGDWIMANPGPITEYAMLLDSSKSPRVPLEVMYVQFENGRHSETCSNTHACPKHGELNWGSKPDKHRGYPGVTGDILYGLNSSFRIYETLKNALHLKVGGGSGGDKCRYDFTMFAEDWPFVGAKILHNARHKEITADHCRIFQYAFPGLDVAGYELMLKNGLLPDDYDGFLNFMMQFVEPKGATVETDMHLPTDVVPAI